MKKVVLRSNRAYEELVIDGRVITSADGISSDDLLFHLAKELGFEYIYERGSWDSRGEWSADKRIGGA